MIDIGLNFCTGYYSRQQNLDMIVMNRRMVMFNYLSTWFVVDVLSLIPFEAIVLSSVEGSPGGGAGYNDSLAKLSKLIRMLKLFRLLRLAGLMRYLKYWSERMQPGLLRLVTSGVIGFLTVHFLACFFFWISDLDPNTVNTWSDLYGVRQVRRSIHL